MKERGREYVRYMEGKSIQNDVVCILIDHEINYNHLHMYRRGEINDILDVLNNVLTQFYKKEYIFKELLLQILCDLCPKMNSYFMPIDWHVPPKYIINLKRVFQPEQRSPEWYAFRKERLTASDIGSVLGDSPYNKPKDILLKKCGYEKPFYINEPCAHGIKYEPVATEIYETRNGVDVHEFGCLAHPDYDFIGASPDGICENGIMLEIKNPYSRKIEGVPPKHYYDQMQIQLEVCDLEICDYLECSYHIFESQEEMRQSITDCRENSVIIEFNTDTKRTETKYLYCHHGKTDKEKVAWVEQKLVELEENSLPYPPIVTWWALREYSVFRVRRNKYWFDSNIETLRQFWEKVKVNRETGEYIKLIPKKRKSKCKLLPDEDSNGVFYL